MIPIVSSRHFIAARSLAALMCICWLFSSGYAFAVGGAATPPAAPRLLDLAGWDVHGLGGGVLVNFTKTDNAFSGTLHLDGVPADMIPDVIGFRQQGQGLFNLALVYPGKSLAPLLPALTETALAELELSGLVVLVSPPAYAGSSVPLPSSIGQVSLSSLGGTTVKLVAGAQLIAGATALRDTAALLSSVGLSPRELKLVGTFDARLLSGFGLKNPPAQADLINATDLRIILKALAPARKPAFLSFGNSELLFKGVGGKIASGIATSLSVNVAGNQRFDPVTINRDPLAHTVSINSTGIKPGGNFISIPVAGAGITQVKFSGLIDEQKPANDRFVLNGQYVVNNSSPRDFSAVLTGQSPAQYVVTVQTDTTLGQMLGWSVPGLDALVLKDVVFERDHVRGNLAIKEVDFTVVLFKSAQQQKTNVAFLHDGKVSLPVLMNALQGTPLADLDLSRLVLVLMPVDNAGSTTVFPEPLAKLAGMPSASLKAGLNLFAVGRVVGEPGKLLGAVGMPAADWKIAGSLDATLLSADARSPMPAAFLDALNLKISLPALAPARKPAYLAFGDAVLSFSGVNGKIASNIVTSMTLSVGSTIRFDPIIVDRDPNRRATTITGGVIAPGSGSISLPIQGATVKLAGFNGLIDEVSPANDRFALTGSYTIEKAAPKNFSAEIVNGTPVQYAVTVNTETRLAELLGWQPAPGLNELMLTDVVFSNGYVLGHVTLRGVVMTVVVFKGDPKQSRSNVAFLHEGSIALPALMSALQGTPLADFDLSKLALILVPPENAGVATNFPLPVSRQLGVQSLPLKAGLNIIAQGQAVGEVRALLDGVGIHLPELRLSGSVDSSLLSGFNSAALVQAFLDALDLKVPLPDITPPGIDQSVTIRNAWLAIKGIKMGIDSAIVGELTVVAQHAPAMKFDTAMHLVKAASGNSVSVAGTYAGAWNQPFGIGWLNVRNVGLSGLLGKTSQLAITGKTDLGSVRDLAVSVDLAGKPAGGSEVAIALTGADISLAAIPVLSVLPYAGNMALRDLLVSPRAMKGTLKSARFPLLHEVSALAFESGGHWNVMALFDDLELTRLLPSGLVPSSLGKLKMRKAGLVFSQSGVTARLNDLSPTAQTELLSIYGSLDGAINVTNGVGLLAVLDTSPLGAAVTRYLPSGQNLVLQGSASGVIGSGKPELALAALIPAINLPQQLRFVSLPSNARTSFFINISEASARFGINIDAVLDVRLGKQTVAFDSTVAFAFDDQGGVTFGLQGKTLNPWRNPLSIPGFTLDTGTRLEVKTSASSEATMTFVGKSHIGKREVDITGSASSVGGVVDQGAFEGKASELAMSDLLALFDAAVQAGGGQPVTVDFPEATLKNVDLAFASPGVSIPEMNLPNGGSRLAGELWFLLKGQPLGKFRSQISDTSLLMDGALGDFTLGPVAMKGNKLDVQARTPPLPLPYFKIHGAATLFGKHVDGEYTLGFTESRIATDIDLGDLLKFDLQASFETPAAGLDLKAMADQDMALNGKMKSDIGAWLRGPGGKVVAAVFDSVTKDLDKLLGDLKTAKDKVDTLNGSLDKARKRALAGSKTVDQQIAQAQKKVDDLAGQIRSLDNDIDTAKRNIHACNYTKSICYWWNWKGHCTKHKDVPDPVRDAECEVDNAHNVAIVASRVAAQKAAQTAKVAADTVLAGLKRGEKGVDIASLDPEVIAIEASLVAANLLLDAAREMTKGAELGVGQLKSGIDALSRPDVFKLTDSSLQGSFKRAVAGKPVVLSLNFEVAGKPQYLRLAVNLTDPVYTARQFAPLALLVAKVAVESSSGAAPVVVHLLNDAYKPIHDAAEQEVDNVLKDNGLLE